MKNAKDAFLRTAKRTYAYVTVSKNASDKVIR